MAKKPYVWRGAKNINWFPGLNSMPKPGVFKPKVPAGSLGASILGSLPTGNPFAPPPSSGGGGNPYSGILNEFLNSSKARFAADSAADAASRDAALRRYIISYGQVPDFDKLGISGEARGFLQKALDSKTKALAEANTKEGTSVYARQARANEVANRRIPAQLAARGMLRSGQTGSDLQEQAQQYKIQGFDTLNEMLGSVEGTVGNFLNAERARADALAQAELQAQMAAMGEYGGDMYGDPGGGYDPFAGLANAGASNVSAWAKQQAAKAAAAARARAAAAARARANANRRRGRGGAGGGVARVM